MTLTVIIPTIGRDSLAAAVASCAGADEVIVVVDEARGLVTLPALPAGTLVDCVTGGDHGYTARTRGIAAATSTHLCFLDDDDVYTRDAIRLFRDAACDVPVVFRMDHYSHGILWREPILEFGNVSTQMFVVPNVPGRLGVWAPHAPGLQEPGGDFTFLAGCVEKMGGPVWREEIVAVLRPDRGASIAIVTPWLDHHDLWADYAAAVESRRSSDDLFVVDNGSTPPLRFGRIRFDENVGFSPASNAGLREAQTDAVLFLNNDVAMTGRDWLERIRAELEPGVLVGAQLRYDPHGSLDGQPLPYLDGWCLAGMRDDLLELGGWDETYEEPSYYGDNDLSLRARAAGMRLREVRVPLVHKNGGTHDPARDQIRAEVTVRNRQRFATVAAGLL